MGESAPVSDEVCPKKAKLVEKIIKEMDEQDAQAI